VEEYVERASRRSERARLAEAEQKTGVFTGAYADHPVTGDRLPVWSADYVLAGYGTGAIMAVPAHDERDYAFARIFELPIVEVVAGGDVSQAAFAGEGTGVNSDFLDGLATPEAKQRMIDWLEEHDRGERTVSYKLRDWLFSRQRYWGEPFPLLHLPDGSTRLVADDELPVLLPELDDYHPSGEFQSPLERAPSWMEVVDPDSGDVARRDANTMPQWAGSCWYYLRFCDPHNEHAPWSAEAERYWMPVDLYVGGAEHAVLHLLYARFWHKVLYDLGLVHTREPFRKLLNQGLVLGYSYRYWDDNVDDDPEATPRCFPSSAVQVESDEAIARPTGAPVKARWVHMKQVRWSEDGTPLHPTLDDLPLEEVIERMAKSRGNVINPDEVIESHGADAMRLYELFMGPFDKGAPWSTDGIAGVYRFLQRAWRMLVDEGADGELVRALEAGPGTEAQRRLLAVTIDGVTRDVEALQFNTAISKLMVFAREVEKEAPLPLAAARDFVLLLAPFAPHLAEELWQRLGESESLSAAPWPEADSRWLVTDVVTLVVQVAGKRRDQIEVPADADEAVIRAAALAAPNVKRHLGDSEPRRVIVVPGRLVNVVP
jgi:leucyl-tRNA synthetase